MFAKSSSVCQYSLLNLRLNNKFPVDTRRHFSVDAMSHQSSNDAVCLPGCPLYPESQSLSNIA